MGKRNAVFLTLSTFLGVVGRESRFVVNHRYDSLMMRDSKQDVADLLDEHEEKKSIQELLRKQQKPQTQRQRKSKRHEQERWVYANVFLTRINCWLRTKSRAVTITHLGERRPQVHYDLRPISKEAPVCHSPYVGYGLHGRQFLISQFCCPSWQKEYYTL